MKKKLLTMTLAALASIGFAGVGSVANASTVVKTAPPQLRIQIGQRHRRHDRDWDRNRGDQIGYGYGRTVVQTRLVRDGWRSYRETYQIRYFPNGETQTTLISRQRIN